MKLNTGRVTTNYFFISLLVFVVALPLSQALVSISMGLILLVALLEGKWSEKIKRFYGNKWVLLIGGIYLVYIISAVTSTNFYDSLYDLRKTVFYLTIPVSFVLGKKLSKKQIKFLYNIFILAIVTAIIIALAKYLLHKDKTVFYIHKVSFVGHIQFSFQLIFTFWLSLYLYGKNQLKKKALLYLPVALFILAFLFFQQSLVGMLSFIATLLYVLLYSIYHYKIKYKKLIYLVLVVALLLPFGYVTWAIVHFYDTETVDRNEIDQKTEEGNYYTHHFDNKLIENGHYVNLYLCEKELKREWNKRATIAYDSLDKNGYTIQSTLIRYMTSKGLRKDAEGIKSLTEEDIKNVENSIANVIYTKSNYSIYPRIYQTIWEYDVYLKTGDSNNKSFAQRIIFGKAAIDIIREYPVFGVGTCCWKVAFANQYKKNNPNFDEQYYASSHNQYLNYLVKFGVVGFVLIVFFILYPIIKTKQYRNPLFMVFFISLLVGNLGDSNFETHMAGAFFALFYSFFLTQDKTEL